MGEGTREGPGLGDSNRLHRRRQQSLRPSSTACLVTGLRASAASGRQEQGPHSHRVEADLTATIGSPASALPPSLLLPHHSLMGHLQHHAPSHHWLGKGEAGGLGLLPRPVPAWPGSPPILAHLRPQSPPIKPHRSLTTATAMSWRAGRQEGRKPKGAGWEFSAGVRGGLRTTGCRAIREKTAKDLRW